METLPEELLSHIFDCLGDATAHSVAMLVCKQWYLRGARNLHHTLRINLTPGLSISSSHTIISFMKRLVSPLSTAHCIHHLTFSGFAPLDLQELILDILGRAKALQSLDMHALKPLQGGMLLPPEIFSGDFLPNLTALNASSAAFSVSLAHTRLINAIRVHEPMEDALLRRFSSPKGPLARRIKFLELALSVDGMATAIERMASLTSTLAHTDTSLEALAVQFVLDRPGPVAWHDFEHAVKEMGPSLQSLENLRTLSIVIRPDPIIPATADGQARSGEQHREATTRRLAEKLIQNNALDRLGRIELRWHGWRVEERQLIGIPRTQLLRLPPKWLFADSQREGL